MSEIPTTMRASVLERVGSIVLAQYPVPTCRPDEVLIKVASVGVCGSDVHYYSHGRIGDYVVESPLVLGHEASGTIVAVGSDVDPNRVGQRVAIEPQRPCRRCGYCRSGRYNLCPEMEFYATPPIDGAFCEYVTIQDDFAYQVPDNVSFDAAALIEPLSVGIAACRKGRVGLGDTVFIAGAGPIGILVAQAARALGASQVVVSDPDPGRREFVLRFGATQVIDPMSEDIERLAAHCFIDASGATPAITAGIKAVRRGGSVVLVGSADVVPLSVPEIAMREVVVTGIFRYTGTWPLAIAMLERGSVQLDPLVTHHYGIEQVERALNAAEGPGSLKRMVLPWIDHFDPVGKVAG